MEAVDRADFHAVGVLTLDTAFEYEKSHSPESPWRSSQQPQILLQKLVFDNGSRADCIRLSEYARLQPQFRGLTACGHYLATTDFHADGELWHDPRYYRCNPPPPWSLRRARRGCLSWVTTRRVQQLGAIATAITRLWRTRHAFAGWLSSCDSRS
jgi:hypothetical protein